MIYSFIVLKTKGSHGSRRHVYRNNSTIMILQIENSEIPISMILYYNFGRILIKIYVQLISKFYTRFSFLSKSVVYYL